MIKTLKGKILSGIILVVLGIYIVINIIIWNVFKDNLEKYIISDLDKIKSIANTQIKQYIHKGEIIKENKNKILILLEELNSSYGTYISIDTDEEENILFIGKLIDKREKENIISESNKKMAIAKINVKEKKNCATYAYPIYIEEPYVGTLILQKDYTVEYLNYKNIMVQIILVEALFYLLMLGIIYFWLTKTTNTLKKLADGMNKMGEGDFTQIIPIRGQDEIAKLTNYFNQMQEKIIHQIEDICREKKKIENLETETKNFFNYATHEMKTPLTAIKGYSELLEQNKLDDNTTKRMAKRIMLETERMYKLVQNMLVIARGKEHVIEKQETFDIKELLQDIIESYKVILRKENKQISLKVVKCDVFSIKEEIKTILINLVDNAIKYSVEDNITISSNHNNPYKIVFSNKIGLLPKEIKENLLEPFTKYNYQDYTKLSSGLGLFICKELMDKNNASLTYEIKEHYIYFILSFKEDK